VCLSPSVLFSLLAYSRDPAFDSFLASLDAANEEVIPFAGTVKCSYLPLEQQAGHAVEPTIFGDRDHGGRLFGRDVYKRLCEAILAQRKLVLQNTSFLHGVLLTGIAGTSKVRSGPLACRVHAPFCSMSVFSTVPFVPGAMDDLTVLRPHSRPTS
jgi:hypothetical protein